MLTILCPRSTRSCWLVSYNNNNNNNKQQQQRGDLIESASLRRSDSIRKRHRNCASMSVVNELQTQTSTNANNPMPTFNTLLLAGQLSFLVIIGIFLGSNVFVFDFIRK